MPASYAQSEEFLLEMFIEGVLIVWDFICLRSAFTQPVCWEGEIKRCAGKHPLKILIFFPSFLFHFKPSLGNFLSFKCKLSDLPANTSQGSESAFHKQKTLQLTQVSVKE